MEGRGETANADVPPLEESINLVRLVSERRR